MSLTFEGYHIHHPHPVETEAIVRFSGSCLSTRKARNRVVQGALKASDSTGDRRKTVINTAVTTGGFLISEFLARRESWVCVINLPRLQECLTTGLCCIKAEAGVLIYNHGWRRTEAVLAMPGN